MPPAGAPTTPQQPAPADAEGLAPGAGGRSLFLIDGANLVYRSYFAFVRAPLTNARGLNTSAPFGFTQTLMKLFEEAKPDCIAVVWDPPGPTERHEQFAEYKATRRAMPDDLRDSLDYVRRIVAGFRVQTLEMPGIEADDVIGTLAKRAEAMGFTTYIVSSDKDFLQLVSDRVRLYNLRKGWTDLEVMGPEETRASWGVGPEGIRDVLALMGDASDNVPGVPGVGRKTAVSLIQQHGTLDRVYEAIDQLKGKRLRERLTEFRDQAELSRALVTIRTDVPVEVDLNALDRQEPDLTTLLPLLHELELTKFAEALGAQVASDPAQQPEEASAPPCEVIEEPAGIAAMISTLKGEPRLAIEVLADAGGRLNGFAFAIPGRSFFVSAAVTGMEGTLFAGAIDRSRMARVLAALGPFLASPPPLVGHDLKRAHALLFQEGVSLSNLEFDTLLAAYMIDPSRRQHGLTDLAQRHLGQHLEAFDGPRGRAALAALNPEALAQAACARATAALMLRDQLLSTLNALELTPLFREVELPLIPILNRMERAGVRIDRALLGRIATELNERLAALEDEITGMAGEPFNVDSPKQLGGILFDKLAIHKELKVRVKRTKTGYSTDQSVLEKLGGHPIVAKILEYRQLRKLKGTYVDALPALADDAGFVHTTFNQAVAATGRLSSSDPNLQNIPIRTAEGRRIRAAFVAGAEDRRLISADYSQVELRILAHMTADPTLVEAFQQGADIHRATAARIFSVEQDAVTLTLRSRAKAVNFGIIYGMGPQRLGTETGISTQEAKEFIERYFERFPGIKQYIDETTASADRDGFVQTIFGRRRALPELRDPSPRVRAQGRSMAVNTPIQGSAADLIKIAMIRIDIALQARTDDARMILQVHDELLFDVAAADVDAVRALVKHEMENVYPDLRVPLKVDIGIGKDWLEAH